MNILLAFTGSVATTLAPKIVATFKKLGDVKVVMTQPAKHFYSPLALHQQEDIDVYTDENEWNFYPSNTLDKDEEVYKKYLDASQMRLLEKQETAKCWSNCQHSYYKKDSLVLHIELRKWADVLVIAPLSANTLAKMANGLCDNLLTSVVRAWDPSKPIVVAPAMNTEMWEGPFSDQHLEILNKTYDLHIVPPQAKRLACGDIGTGAMAQIDDICFATQDSLTWANPLEKSVLRVPYGYHPGAFGFTRKYDVHTGVDLYANPFYSKEKVYAVEGGTVVAINHFTGPQVNMPWWYDTDAVLVEGYSGVVAYCEVEPASSLKVGSKVKKGDHLANLVPVLPKRKVRNDIPGHSNQMLHLELYEHGARKWQKWVNNSKPKQLKNPTELLLGIDGAEKLPLWQGKISFDNSELIAKRIREAVASAEKSERRSKEIDWNLRVTI